jgi:hypothetical protein
MAHKFMLQLSRRYDIKRTEKTAQTYNFTFDVRCLEKSKQHRRGTNQRPLGPKPCTHTCEFRLITSTQVYINIFPKYQR